MFARHVRPILLAAALVLPSVGCSDSLVTPEEVQAQTANASDRELLLTILARLDAMEARVEQEAGTVRAALEAITGVEDLRVAFAPGNSGGNGNSGNNGGGDGAGGGQGLAAGLDEVRGDLDSLAAMTDQLFTLAEWMATEMSSPWSGLESCFAAKLKGNADFKSITHGDAEAEGGVGVKPWDTGVLAKVNLRQRLGIEFGAGAEFEVVALGGCLNWGNLNASPPVRPGPTPAGVQMASTSGLAGALRNVPGQLGITEAGLEQLMQAGTSLVQSGDLSRIQEVASLLPMPAQARSPLAAVRGRLASFDAVDLLCGGTNFGTSLASYVSQGCGYIQGGNLPNLGIYLNMGNNFSNLQANFGSLCGRFNNVVDRRLVVNNNLPWGGSNVLDVALFPSSWNVTC
jgi:hypothetical protein